jgi:hypothetical protein
VIAFDRGRGRNDGQAAISRTVKGADQAAIATDMSALGRFLTTTRKPTLHLSRHQICGKCWRQKIHALVELNDIGTGDLLWKDPHADELLALG